MNSKSLIILFILCFYIGCDSGNQDCVPPPPPTIDTFKNVVILLDLSSRVRLPNQDKKDIAILQHIIAAFEQEQRQYGFQISEDKLDVKIALQDGAITQPFNFGDDLTIDMSVNQMNKPNFDTKKKSFLVAATQMYSQATKGPTTGADIWNFFDDRLSSCLKNEKKFKNKIIILTDGYLEFDSKIANSRPKDTYFNPNYKLLRNKDNWQALFKTMKLGLRPCKKFDNTEVLMLEISPTKPVLYTNEYQILEKIWSSWFSDMNIPSQMVQTDGNTQNLKPVIQNFISK